MVVYWWRYRRAAKHGELDQKVSSVDRHESSGPETRDTNLSLFTGAHPDTAAAEGPNFTLFVYALLIAYLAVLIRCIYRWVSCSRVSADLLTNSIPEMALGWGSTLMQNETLFLILDGA
jgi:hypothetical protein